jgi:hypothetical protein
MPNYCMLMTVNTSNLSGKVDDANVNWVSPDAPGWTDPGSDVHLFHEGDSISVGLCIMQGAAPNAVPILPADLVIAAIVTPKDKTQANASPYRFGGVATGNRKTMLLGSITGQGTVSKLVAFDANGKIGSWDGVTYKWIGFDYGECLLFHDSLNDTRFELTMSARLSASQSWAYDPEMDVGKKNK